MRTALFAVLLALSALAAAGFAHAQEPAPAAPQVMKVGVYISPPFVMKEGTDYSGMAIDLWERVTDRLKLVSDYEEFRNYTELVDALATGRIDAAVTNLSITESRAERVDFTHPWFDAGLRVMIAANDGASLAEVIGGLGSAGHLKTYAWIIFAILLATALLTVFDRKFDADFPRRWRDGIAESFYHVMSIATSGKASRKNLFGWAGRIWQGFWMVCGVAVIAYITSSITSVMT
ncbi:MAG: transporter substrate-binding domain-containing protein, partial [Alphaproteobacteria bacterium]